MKEINRLLQQARPGKSEDEGARSSASGSPGSGHGRDHVDAVNQMFAEFELAYHNQFHKAYAREGSVALAKKYWLSRLSRFSPEVILKATREVVSSQEFLPTLSTLSQACENAMALYGLPSAHDAYVEACCAPEPKAGQSWSHPAVYHAGRATGWYELATRPESRIYPVFEYHYRIMCNRVMNGEDLHVTPPKPLPERSGTPLSPEENHERLRALRKSLKL